RPGVDILTVQLDNIFKVIHSPITIQLPQAGEARLHTEAAVMMGLVLAHLVRGRRTGPHQTDLPSQHIPELRQLIEMPASEYMSDRYHPRVIPHFKDRPVHLIASK